MSAFGGKRTLLSERVMSAFDPKRTLAGLKSRSAAVSYLGVRSMAWPGGNVTGFTQFEYSLAGKWLELLKEIAPHVTRVGVLRDPTRGYGNRPVRRDPGDGTAARRGTYADRCA